MHNNALPEVQLHMENLYDKYEENYKSLLTNSFLITRRLSKTAIYICGLAFHLPMLSTIKHYLINGKYVLPVLIYLPCIDRHSTFGFALNLIILIGLASLGFFGLVTHDAAITLYGSQCISYVNVLIKKAQELDNEVQARTIINAKKIKRENLKLKAIRSENKVKEHLLDLIKLHGDYRYYIGHPFFAKNVPT
jgi:hypothetical protein